ncbi:WxL protein host-binding domain-containing protein [Bacillus thermotolerans]|uniref:Cell surface protein n=1 Tax=Bacillus thermotolerans TaxID=1221996 RepID=A0A0F5HTG3_BACTR|nr:DUF3324 domain-containing protein [Bacillus thermotolerans]KKB36142.1 cell surface protein precursor [Bacillus thermotolerans]
MTIGVRIYKEKEDQPLKEIEQKNIRMASNSTMDLVTDWGSQPLEPGDYYFETEATYGGETIKKEQALTIGGKQASALNDEAVELDESDNYIWYAAGMVVLVLIVAVLVFYIGSLKCSSRKE